MKPVSVYTNICSLIILHSVPLKDCMQTVLLAKTHVRNLFNQISHVSSSLVTSFMAVRHGE